MDNFSFWQFIADRLVLAPSASAIFRFDARTYPTNFASQVTVVHRRDHFRAERILQDRLFKHPKIKVIWNSAIDEIGGAENPTKVTHVRLKNVKTGALTEVPADGVFIAIGHAPATDLVKGQIKLICPSVNYGQI